MFGLFLTMYTLKIMYQQKYIATLDIKEIKGKTLNIMTSSLFSERNLIETFGSRFKSNIKYTIEEKNEKYFNIKNDEIHALIYPSFTYRQEGTGKGYQAMDESKLPNLLNIDDNHVEYMRKLYTISGKLYAAPVAYVPYAIFFDKEKIKPSTTGKSYFTGNIKVALSGDYGSFLALVKILGLKPDMASVASIQKTLGKGNVILFDPDKLDAAADLIKKEKSLIVIAPIYLKSYMETRVELNEVILPDEGTYATLYLVSIVGDGELELSHIFVNHVIDPSIQKTLCDILGYPVINKLALKSMEPLQYNTLKMNTPEYFKNLLVLKNRKEFDNAVNLYNAFIKGL